MPSNIKQVSSKKCKEKDRPEKRRARRRPSRSARRSETDSLSIPPASDRESHADSCRPLSISVSRKY